MLRRNFLTGIAKTAILSFSLSTGLNTFSAILPARNKIDFSVDWIAEKVQWIVVGEEIIGGERWLAPDYMTDISQLESIMFESRKALNKRYNLIHGVT